MWIVTIHAAVVMVVSRSWSCSFCIGAGFFTRSFQGPVYSYQFTKAKAGSNVSSLSCYLIVPTVFVDPNFLWLWGIGFTSPGSW